MRRILTTMTAAIALACAAATVQADSERHITLASTTSTEASGLFGHIIPKFRESSGIDVRVVAVGTGQAFEIGRRGDADTVLVHDPAGEEQFVENGYGADRQDIMYNDFVVIGPEDDPAGIANAESAAEAFSLIAEHDAPFTSRGDDSGTNRAELRLWASAGVEDPSGSWYRELGSGMGATLNTAASMNAYVMADRATWIAFDNRQDLAILFEGDDALFNQYGSLLINPERHPDLKHEMAREWHEWLQSEEGQQAIGTYELGGQQLFFPNAQ